MKQFKQLVRSVMLVLLVGGWALASAAVHVIRAPGQSLPIFITKDHLGYKDTYVDTRAWTINDDRAHPAVVLRLIHLGQADVLAHTVNSNGVPVEAQLLAIVGSPNTTTSGAAATDTSLTDKGKAAVDAVKSKLN